MIKRIKQYIQSQKPVAPKHPLLSLTTGMTLHFSPTIAIAMLADKYARILSVRRYQFGSDVNYTYTLQIENILRFYLTVAKDEQGVYIGLSRELPKTEWTDWFDKDALDFFLTPTSARTLKLHKNAVAPLEWSAERYSKVIDGLQGDVAETKSARPDQPFRSEKLHYTLLVNEGGDRAIEIELLPEKKLTRLFSTLYRPASDIVAVYAQDDEMTQHLTSAKILTYPSIHQSFEQHAVAFSKPESNRFEQAAASQYPRFSAAHEANSSPIEALDFDPNHKKVESNETSLPAFMSSSATDSHKQVLTAEKTDLDSQKPPAKIKPDFRRRSVDFGAMDMSKVSTLPLPSFLLTPKSQELKTSNGAKRLVSLTEQRHLEQLRCDKVTAKTLLDEAVRRSMGVRDVVREMLGLNFQMPDEVVFDIALSDDDYKTLAARYQIAPSNREEIRTRMLDELSGRISRPLN